MKVGEFKIRITTSLMKLVDTYFNEQTMTEKFINSTLKLIIKQNVNKFDKFLQLFVDENGEIDGDVVMAEYSQMIGESGVIFDIKQYIDNEMIRNFIPDKALVIKREDILNLLKQ